MDSATQSPGSGSSGSSGLLWGCGIIGCLGLILILLIGGGFAGWTYYKKVEAERAGTAVSGDGSAPATPGVVATGATPVKVVLDWDAPVDMDLEIWDSAGENLKHRAFNLCGEDIKNGTAGDEWFEFKTYPEGDYSTGEFTVSAFFAGREDNAINRASIKLRVIRPDGTTEERTKAIQWEQGKDQWHAFRINAATGAITNVDRFIRIESRPNN